MERLAPRFGGTERGVATVIATLPPPNTGMTTVTTKLVTALERRGHVYVTNLSANGAAQRRSWKVIRSLRQMAASVRVLAGRAGQGNLYIALNSGTAVILDALLLGAARLRKRKVFVHHHSFRFINTRSRLLQALYTVGGDSVVDIALCEGMAKKLNQLYGRTQIRVVPNLVESASPDRSAGDHENVRLGHLSNLSLEKGVGRTIEAFAYAFSSGADVELHLAGPFATDSAREIVKQAISQWPDHVYYHGSVYGSEKVAFYSSLDLFVYPTAYVVEAQPLVLLEALSTGTPIISVDRGCIRGFEEFAVGEAVTICRMQDIAEVTRNIASSIGNESQDQRRARYVDAVATAEAFASNARIALYSLIDEILGLRTKWDKE